jgi:hypothetical protein
MPWRCGAYLAAALGLASGTSAADTQKALVPSPELAASYLQHIRYYWPEAATSHQQHAFTVTFIWSRHKLLPLKKWPKLMMPLQSRAVATI